jgi:hypothetical protein
MRHARVARLLKQLTVVGLATCVAVLIAPVAANASGQAYTTVDTLPHDHGCNTTEGFAVGSTYTYSIKINSDETAAVIYRTNMSAGTTQLMTNGDNGSTYASYLGHANDIVLNTAAGEYYMYVVTMASGSINLVKLKYVSNTYYKVGSYSIHYNGSPTAMSGIKIVGTYAGYVSFLFKSLYTFYSGSIAQSATSGTIDVSKDFSVDVTHAKVNGSTIANVSSYATQGIGYYNDTVYYPLTSGATSYVLVYQNISNAYSATQPIASNNNLNTFITSVTYAYHFEIEGLGVANGRLYFNTNRKKDANDLDSDGVHYFTNITV